MGPTTSTIESPERPSPGAPEPVRAPSMGKSESLGKPASRWVVPVFFTVFATAMAVMSKGFLEADEVTHFLKARSIWTDWRAILDIWGRFGATGLFGLAAPFGLMAARLEAVGVTVLTGIATSIIVRYFIGESEKHRAGEASWIARHAEAFGWLLLFAQPCLALNCFTVMTEMLLTCTWAWAAAILILSRGKPGRGILLAGFVLGLGGLMRPEGWLAVAAWPVFSFVWMARHREAGKKTRWVLLLASTFLAGLPSLTWYLLGVVGWSDWLWMINQWPWSVKSQYGETGKKFIMASLVSLGVWMWAPVVIGAARLWMRRGSESSRVRGFRSDARLLLVTPMVCLYGVHGVLGSAGLFGSMSMPRYFVAIAPMAATLAILGLIELETIWPAGPLKRLARLVPVAAVGLPVFSLVSLFSVGWLPMKQSTEMRRLDVAIAEVKKRIPPEQYQERLTVGHPYSVLVLGLPLGTKVDGRVWDPDAMAAMPEGSLLVTDSMLWYYEKRPTPEQLLSWGYRIDEATDKQVEAMTESLGEKSLWHPGKVRLWIKREARSDTPANLSPLDVAATQSSHPRGQ